MKKLLGRFSKKEKQTEGQAMTKGVNPGLFEVATGAELLQTEARQAKINKIKSLISLPEKHYDALVNRLLERYAGFVQQLPATENHHHAVPGGLLDHSLEVTLMSLLIRRGFMLPIGAPPELLAKKQEIWTYATLTAALLKHVGVATIQQVVTLYDTNQKPTGKWQPIEKSLEDAAYYDLSFKKANEMPLGARMTPLIVKQIIPEEGLLWLCSDSDIITQWLAVLSSDAAGSGILGQIVDRANKENIMKHAPKTPAGEAQAQSQSAAAPQAAAQQAASPPSVPATQASSTTQAPLPPPMPSTQESISPVTAPPTGFGAPVPPPVTEANGAAPMMPDQGPQTIAPMGVTPPPVNPAEAQPQPAVPAEPIPEDMGEFFIYWLKRAIASKQIVINAEKSKVHHVKEGLFLVFPGIFQQFVDDNSEIDTDADTVEKRFVKMGIHKKRGSQNMINYATYASGKRMVYRGIVLPDPSIVVDKEKLPKPSKDLEEDFI